MDATVNESLNIYIKKYPDTCTEEIWGTVRRLSQRIIGTQEEETRVKGTENIFNKSIEDISET
jgi:hypothetical protein